MTGQLQCIYSGQPYDHWVFRAQELRKRNRRIARAVFAVVIAIIVSLVIIGQARSAMAARADVPPASQASIAETIASVESSGN